MLYFKKVHAIKNGDMKSSYFIFFIKPVGEFYIINKVQQKFNVWKFFNIWLTVKFNMFLLDFTSVDFVLEAHDEKKRNVNEYLEEVGKVLRHEFKKAIEDLDSKTTPSNAPMILAIKHQLTNSLNTRIDSLYTDLNEYMHVTSSFIHSDYELLHTKTHGATKRFTFVKPYDENVWLISIDVLVTSKGHFITNLNQIVVPHEVSNKITKNLKGGK